MFAKRNNHAFIDSQNLNLSIQEQGWKLDFKKFRVYLNDKYGVTKAFIFIGYLATNQSLYTALQDYGYIVIFKPTLNLPDGRTKGNIDAELVLHAMIEFSNFEKAVIVTGDGDFYCLIEHLKRQGKMEKLLIPSRDTYSSLFRKFVSAASFVSDLRQKLEYKK